mgnify:CR=1 FL=1
MKLVRYGTDGREKPGLIDSEGKLRDLSPAIETIDQATLSPQGLDRLRSIAPESLPRVKGNPRLGVPFTGISKIVGVGLNYRDHAHETGAAIPSEPVLFMKATTSINGPNDDIVLPRGSTSTDWEAELVKLQSDVPPFPNDQVRQIIIEELGAPPEELYATFDPQPFAAASTAQVHRYTDPAASWRRIIWSAEHWVHLRIVNNDWLARCQAFLK